MAASSAESSVRRYTIYCSSAACAAVESMAKNTAISKTRKYFMTVSLQHSKIFLIIPYFMPSCKEKAERLRNRLTRMGAKRKIMRST